MNKIILMGRLTQDPEVRYTQKDNTPVARYSLAVDKKYKREDGITADFFIWLPLVRRQNLRRNICVRVQRC